ncbi:MAG: hypothetical protein K2G47_02160 [Muribaculum sp.]|nr:hypothetical protein [Muribaculum sp.]
MAGSLWIVWTIIGIVGGFMVGRLVRKVRSTAFAVCVGICGALLGGWLMLLVGSSATMQAVSLLAAAACCAVFLWIMCAAIPKSGGDSDDL